jgi:hypothetical protein
VKRIAAIMVVAALILTMSVGTAYAAACAGMVCSPSGMAKPMMGVAVCPEMAGQNAVMHTTCDHRTGHDTKEAVAVQPSASDAMVAYGLPVPPAVRSLRAERVSVSGDARGAPHLTSVIRI